MKNNIIRLLKADEIECRAATVNAKGVSLLLYKDARVDQRILDETFGAFGWQRSHQCIDGNLYCTVSIYDKESGTWIAKQDVGATGYAEKEKAQASDSFKRACFNWGIGRELYTAPFIWVPADMADIRKQGERYVCSTHFSVHSIGYSQNGDIADLVIVDGKGKPVFEWKGKEVKQGNSKKKTLSRTQMDSLKAELERTGVAMETVQDRYQIHKPETMSEELYNKVMAALSKTKSVAA